MLQSVKTEIKSCTLCRKKFNRQRKSYKQFNSQRYCSLSCKNAAQMGISREFSLEHIRNLREAHSKGQFAGDKNPAWKGDNVTFTQLLVYMRKVVPKPPDGLCPVCKWRKVRQLINFTGLRNKDPRNWHWRCHYRCNEHTTGYRFAGTVSDHLCEDGCGRFTEYSTRPPYGPNNFLPGHYARTVSKEGFNCKKCADKNWIVECKCLKHCGTVFPLRDKEGRKREYAWGSGHSKWGKIVPSMWKVGRTPEEEQEAIRDWAKRNGHVPKPDFCQICNKRPPETLLSTIEENHVRGDRTGYLWSCYTCCRRHIEGLI